MDAATQTPRNKSLHGTPLGISGEGVRRKHLDLFSGIGGFALAAQRAGWNTIGFSEIEPYASKILKRHWPDVPNHGDIRNIRGIAADLITGGFPCQPYSLAGQRRGASDDRALWPEMLRVIAETGPAWVLGENVPGIINMELDRVLSDLEAIGYTAGALAIPACGVDARHRRERIWIVAHAERAQRRPHNDRRGCSEQGRNGKGQAASGIGERGQVLADPNESNRRAGGNGWEQATGKGPLHEPARPSGSAESLANGIGAGLEERAEQSTREERSAIERSGVALSDARCGGGEGARNGECGREEPSWWEPEPELGRVAHGIPNRSHRLRGLGNAIVPQVAEPLLRWMLEITEGQDT